MGTENDDRAALDARYDRVAGGYMLRGGFIPDHLIFTRKSGAMYLHVGTTSTGWHHTERRERIKSLLTGEYREMDYREFVEFKNS